MGDSPAPPMSAQRWPDGINIPPNAVLTFNRPLGVQIVCLGFLWIHRNVDKKCCFFQFENIEKTKIMICEIYCFTQNKIPKLNVITRSPFNKFNITLENEKK